MAEWYILKRRLLMYWYGEGADYSYMVDGPYDIKEAQQIRGEFEQITDDEIMIVPSITIDDKRSNND